MTEDALSTTAKKAIIPLILKDLYPWLLSVVLSGLAYVYTASVDIVSHPQYTKYSLILLALLLCTTILFLILWVRLYWRYSRLHFAFGVLWDKEFRMHCTDCHSLLKYSTQDPSILYCSRRRCDNKHVLQDQSGNKISQQEAIKRLKSPQQAAGGDGQ